MDNCKIVNEHAALMRAEQEKKRKAAEALIVEKEKWAKAKKQRARRRRISTAVCYCSSIIMGFLCGFSLPAPISLFAAAGSCAIISLLYIAWNFSSNNRGL